MGPSFDFGESTAGLEEVLAIPPPETGDPLLAGGTGLPVLDDEVGEEVARKNPSEETSELRRCCPCWKFRV
jgi:hypothetical protein